MRFQVPQFIEVEDKIFGPLTLKQFIYIAGAGGATVLLWTILPRFMAILIAGPIIVLALALAFYKINNRPFINVVQSAFSYLMSNRLYVWKQTEKKRKDPIKEASKKQNLLNVPNLSESKLKDLSWSLDIKESIYSEENQQK